MIRRLLLVAMLACLATGCAKFMGGLRRDLDDSPGPSYPTVGGRWTEGDLLADENDGPGSVGHSERGPASARNGSPGHSSWVTPDTEDAYRRDQARSQGGDEEEAAPSYANTPAMPPPTARMYKNGSRATRADFTDEAPDEGSLWASSGQTNYYFTKNKIRGVGDIVMVTAETELVRDTSVEVMRTLSPRERDIELNLAQERIRNKALGIDDKSKDSVTASAAAPARTPAAAAKPPKEGFEAEEPSIPKAAMSDIDVSKSLDMKTGDTVMAEIVERYPNGNYKLRGTKKMRYRNGTRTLTLLGVVRGTDISEDDVVSSGKLYEYRLQVVR